MKRVSVECQAKDGRSDLHDLESISLLGRFRDAAIMDDRKR
jgi:hypothetical protein